MGAERQTTTPHEVLNAKIDTLENLERESNLWIGLNTRVKRTGGLDGELLLLKKDSMDRLDSYLDTLFSQNVQLQALGLEHV
jgi:hypothetical protein